MASRWVRPEVSFLGRFVSLSLSLSLSHGGVAAAQVYPLFAAMGVAVGICGFQLFRNITGNPEVRSGSGLFNSFNRSILARDVPVRAVGLYQDRSAGFLCAHGVVCV
jgi:hypothetical protein